MIISIIFMQLSSQAFSEGGSIPIKYTCDGQGINPPLQISGVPEKARSLVLLMDDPDIPAAAKKNFNMQAFDHWVVFNIPPAITEIAEGQNPPGTLGQNTGGRNDYASPCPPDREHRYFFKLYALDTVLNLPAGSAKSEVENAMNGHVLESAELMGRYARR